MFTSILTTVSLLIASLAAAFVVTGQDPFWTGGSAVMLASGHLIGTAVTIVGALVGAARWSRWVGAALAGLLAVAALLHPITPAWIVMVGAAGIALAGVLGTGLRAVIRQRPPAGAPPVRATALALGLLAAPLMVAAPQPGGVDVLDWVVASLAVALAVWYTRARPTALWATRFGTPLLAVAEAFTVPLPGAVALVLFFAGLTALAWSTDARIAVIPLAAPGRAVPIPAELTPEEILDAAGIDRRGRRKDQS